MLNQIYFKKIVRRRKIDERYTTAGIFMKAIVSNRYGQPDVLEVKEIEKPIPEDNHGVVSRRDMGLSNGLENRFGHS
jgi:hypothetical protein